MDWEQKVIKSCINRQLRVVCFESGWVSVKGKIGQSFPISEEVIMEWIERDMILER